MTAPGRAFSDYENSVGTGQVHLWFDRPAGGCTASEDIRGPQYPPERGPSRRPVSKPQLHPQSAAQP